LANIVVCTQRKCLQIFDTDGSRSKGGGKDLKLE
jgi:hypothetical protein